MKDRPDFSSEEMATRLGQVRQRMDELGYEVIIATDPANVRYLSGFKGEPRTLLVTQKDFVLITAVRSYPWAREQTSRVASTLELVTSNDPAAEIVGRIGNPQAGVALDAGISYQRITGWRKKLSSHKVEAPSIIEHVRRIKSPAEVALMRQSQALNESILAAVLPQIRPHMTERAVQGLLLAEMARKEAVEEFAFAPIVAAGGNCWEIHHRPDGTVLGRDQLVLLDLGVVCRGYSSDMTRTVCLGKSSTLMRDIHDLVKTALEASLQAAIAGCCNRELDRVARDLIEEAGFGETFTHGLGHHIGMAAHDPAPALSRKAEEIALEPGMALTLEPGVYLKNQFGVRTEDVVVITEGAPDNLTVPSHDLLELDL